MKVFFDQGVPVPLRDFLSGHSVTTAFERGWDTLSNGELIAAVEVEFDVFVSTDKNLRYQQNLSGRRLIIVILPTPSWPRLKPHGEAIRSAIEGTTPGNYIEWQFPVVG
ncbi:MAG: hypothetical protein KDM91_19690 [Verrucomicrobiae bacterium]|nr:hypothetical protein [Verrucomicrobiae bacterium]